MRLSNQKPSRGKKKIPSIEKEMNNGKTVLASGVFDLLHLGHVKFLEEAKKTGGKNARLVVIIARDSTVIGTKAKKPIMPENQRRTLVQSLRVVDEAILGLEGFEIGDIINQVKPDVIALGYDQVQMEKQVRKYIEENKLNATVARIAKFDAEELDSSSKIKQKIVKSER
jgi:FAD synthetase